MRQPRPGPSTIVVDGPMLASTDGPRLCERLRDELERTDADRAVVDVAAVTVCDVSTVDALARVLLTARRLRRDVTLCNASTQLRELLALAGLDDDVT